MARLTTHICVTQPQWVKGSHPCGLFNSSHHSAADMCQWTGAALLPIMACRLIGAKPLSANFYKLSKIYLVAISITIYFQINPIASSVWEIFTLNICFHPGAHAGTYVQLNHNKPLLVLLKHCELDLNNTVFFFQSQIFGKAPLNIGCKILLTSHRQWVATHVK